MKVETWPRTVTGSSVGVHRSVYCNIGSQYTDGKLCRPCHLSLSTEPSASFQAAVQRSLHNVDVSENTQSEHSLHQTSSTLLPQWHQPVQCTISQVYHLWHNVQCSHKQQLKWQTAVVLVATVEVCQILITWWNAGLTELSANQQHWTTEGKEYR